MFMLGWFVGVLRSSEFCSLFFFFSTDLFGEIGEIILANLGKKTVISGSGGKSRTAKLF